MMLCPCLAKVGVQHMLQIMLLEFLSLGNIYRAQFKHVFG